MPPLHKPRDVTSPEKAVSSDVRVPRVSGPELLVDRSVWPSKLDPLPNEQKHRPTEITHNSKIETPVTKPLL